MKIDDKMLIDTRKLLICVTIGGLIGLGIISMFVFGIDREDPAWGDNWRIRPLIVTPLVAALGGSAFYLVQFLKPKSLLIKIGLYAFSGFAFVVALWVGIILGLDGTLWN